MLVVNISNVDCQVSAAVTVLYCAFILCVNRCCACRKLDSNLCVSTKSDVLLCFFNNMQHVNQSFTATCQMNTRQIEMTCLLLCDVVCLCYRSRSISGASSGLSTSPLSSPRVSHEAQTQTHSMKHSCRLVNTHSAITGSFLLLFIVYTRG